MSNSAQTINDGEAIGTDRVGGVRRSSSSRQVRKKINKKSPASKESWQSLHDAVVPKISNEKFQNKSDEDDSSGASIGDICRICHMGGFPPLTNSPPIWEWQNQTARSVDSQMSTLSTYAYLGPLISACNCRGTVGLVHAECLERWLTESGHSRCELCGHRYATKRVPRHSILRSVIIWFRTVIATRQMLLDIIYLMVTTPLALFSCYVCALALRMILESGLYEIPWMIVAMLPTCSLTLVAYWGWLITLGRYINRLHGRRWRRFWRNNFVVRLLPERGLVFANDDGDPRPISTPSRNQLPRNREETLEQNPIDDMEDFLRIL
ncbi:E3 ubiquitin-protein ligase MARCH3 isoform X2 [Cephus cinctus]|uniref:E3 ubiquitin-protein ligase MARCH3 isoform X2 n=1 Tax=Cephus cinctus TaxID=211228 RepID=A0AAJ7RP94_CEPCN|nr:E3 ubiquitin-protein ligase MARCH3 isoform X2 [Cephus cinctus]